MTVLPAKTLVVSQGAAEDVIRGTVRLRDLHDLLRAEPGECPERQTADSADELVGLTLM